MTLAVNDHGRSSSLAALEELLAGAADRVPGLSRLTAALRRVESSGADVLKLIEGIADAATAAPRATSGIATREQEAALRAAGSFVGEMPPLEERASIRSQAAWAGLRGRSLSTSDVAALLQVSTSRVRQRAADHTLYAFPGQTPHRFPEFQFTQSDELPGWTELARRIPDDAHPLAVFRIVTEPSEELLLEGGPVSPRDWLASGGDSAKAVEVLTNGFLLP
ncbi:hypothetical protein [Rathayibacter tritici]|uniref:DNA-binding protein n=1 Tax=Rathayibacter tritici TaxID=33888 RepID=A0A160KUQ2_9MICO|nr:hypothetical protein [Rathayibacter tritici]AND17367.1 hypothetical protein A6122_2244 [Rathayibacter tritici]